MKSIITVLDGITETSMPFNEFVLYRANHNIDEKHYLIICGKKKQLPDVIIPDNLKIIYVGKNPLNIRKKLNKIVKDLKHNNEEYFFHFHQINSGFLTHLSMIGKHIGKKSIFTVHSTYTGYSIKNKILSFCNALFANNTVCVSKTSYENYSKLIKKIKKDKISFIQNGVDIERISNVIKNIGVKNKNSNITSFIYVARVIPLKNHKFLIDVLKECDNRAKFVFVGNDSDANDLKTIINELKLNDRVEFTGLISRNEVFKKIVESDVYITSSTLEGMPVSVLEAGYCKLPLILSDIPQHKELASNTEKEFIHILPFKVVSWVSTINKYCNMKKKAIEDEGNECHKYIEMNFSLNSMHKKYDEIYDKLLKK